MREPLMNKIIKKLVIDRLPKEIPDIMYVKDVKEFIKEIKADILKWDYQANQVIKIINERAGEDLI